MTHCRLVYQSTVQDDVLANEEASQIAETSLQTNARDGITGLLLLLEPHFLQVLEGPPDKVNALFQRICRDKRHHTVELIWYGAASELYFEDWSMRLLDLYDLPMNQRSLFMKKYESEGGLIKIPEKLHDIYALLLDAKAICNQPPGE